MTSPSTSKPPTLEAPPEPKAQRIRRMFDGIAPTYDLLNDCISLGQHRRWKRIACQRLELKPGDTVLDICTGTGDLVQYLLPAVSQDGIVHGVDFSEPMLDVGRQRYGKQASKSVQFKLGDAMNLPYGDNAMNGSIISFGLRNITDTQRAIDEMARVTKPGGWVVSLDTSPEPKLPGYWLYFSVVMPLVGRMISRDPEAYDYLFKSTKKFHSPEALKQMFEAAGLTNVSIQPLSFGSVAIIAGRKPL